MQMRKDRYDETANACHGCRAVCGDVFADTSQAFSSNEHHGQAERNTTWLPKSENHTEDDIPDTEHASLDRTKTAVRSIAQHR